MLDRTQLKRHISDIVSASATKSGSDVKLIDQFQLVLQIYWDDGEITEENVTTTNSQVFTHTYADVSTASDVLHSFSLSRASTRSM